MSIFNTRLSIKLKQFIVILLIAVIPSAFSKKIEASAMRVCVTEANIIRILDQTTPTNPKDQIWHIKIKFLKNGTFKSGHSAGKKCFIKKGTSQNIKLTLYDSMNNKMVNLQSGNRIRLQKQTIYNPRFKPEPSIRWQLLKIL